MNTAQLAEKISAEHDLPKTKAKLLIAALLDAITEAASRGEEVSLPGFGKFKVVARPAREGRNPATGGAIQIPASRKLAYVAAKQVKERLSPAAG